MITLVCTNRAKYAPFGEELERLRIRIEPPPFPLPEIQTLDFKESAQAKARAAAESFGRPVLVDEAGLVLESWPHFPGPITSPVLQGLGVGGLKQLVQGRSARATLECHLACAVAGEVRIWSGAAPGRLDFSRQARDPRMILTDLFVPDAGPEVKLPHRAAALRAFATDAFALHLELAKTGPAPEAACALTGVPPCPFCAELADSQRSIFGEMVGGRLHSRVVYEDEWFVVMPALGQFIPGGLLLLTREHIRSFACLPPERFEQLERLLKAVERAVTEQWGVPPLVFEHGPAPEQGKGVCCVDHAHFNLFPAAVPLHPRLESRLNLPLPALADLARLRQAEYGYLFVQENDGSRRAYDGQHVPTQLVRRFIASAVGVPERWHWRDYPGVEELVNTFRALNGRIRL